MLEKIVKSIQDLEALSALYLENAISSEELNRCKTNVMENLKVNKSRISIAEIVEPLQSLRRLYLVNILSVDEYNTARDLLLSHARTASGNLDAYTEVFDIYKQGLISVGDLHKVKMKLLGEQSDLVRVSDPNIINRLRDSSNPFVPGELRSILGREVYKEISEGQWRADVYPNGPTLEDHNIQQLYNIGGYVLDWGTEESRASVSNSLRRFISENRYNQREVLLLALGLTNEELRGAITDMENPETADSNGVLNIFKTLIPIFKP